MAFHPAGLQARSLNLTLSNGSTTGAKPCYYSGASRITTHYAAGNAIHLTYRVNANVNGTNYTGWWADANWNTDTTDRMRMYNSILAASAITAGYLIVSTSSGYSHLAGGITFDVNRPILYPGSAISSGSTGNNNYLSFPSVNLRNIMGSSWSGTTRATAYIAGNLNGTSFTTLSSGCITTSPTTEGTYYISLGYMPNTYQMYLYPEHPIYICYGGTLRSVSQIAYQAQLDATHAQTTADAALPQVDFQRVVRIDDDGLHVGDNQSSGEVLIDSESVNVVMSGQKYSKFAGSYVQFGNYQLRRSSDGGLVFKLA